MSVLCHPPRNGYSTVPNVVQDYSDRRSIWKIARSALIVFDCRAHVLAANITLLTVHQDLRSSVRAARLLRESWRAHATVTCSSAASFLSPQGGDDPVPRRYSFLPLPCYPLPLHARFHQARWIPFSAPDAARRDPRPSWHSLTAPHLFLRM
jgi:hypothetical protein